MAKIYGLNGVIRGRQGNNVFCVQSGTQVVKAYQPVVSNPRTFLQQIQRAKFALAGKLSSVVPESAIVGMSGSDARSRRAAFVAIVAKAATTTSTPSGSGVVVTAVVPYQSVRFSQGSLPYYSTQGGFSAAYTGTAGAYRLHVDLDGFSGHPIASDAPTGYGELIVCCMFNPATSRLDACQAAVRGEGTVSFDFAVFSRSAAHVCVYVCPFAPINRDSSYGAASYLDGANQGISLDMLSRSFLRSMSFGNSVMSFSQDVAAVTTMNSPSSSDDRGSDSKKK